MKKTATIILVLLTFCATAQKKVTCKKGSIKSDGKEIAEFDGVGGFKNLKIGVFAPGSKDTLIAVAEEFFAPKNPLFQTLVVYKMQFNDAGKTNFYVKPGIGSYRIIQRQVAEILFNDSLPLPVVDNKLDDAAIAILRSKLEFDLDAQNKALAEVKDTMNAMKNYTVNRDKSKPLTFRKIGDKSTLNKLYPQYDEIKEVYHIYQNDVLVGMLEKEIKSGSFAGGKYTFWKAVPATKVQGKELRFLPVAFAETSPGITSNESQGDVIIELYDEKDKRKLKATKGHFGDREAAIGGTLVANRLM